MPQLISGLNTFNYTAYYKYSWANVAQNLFHSSKVLWRDYLKSWKRMEKHSETNLFQSIPSYKYPGANILQVSQMLAGLSLENLVKGIIILKNPIYVGETEINEKLAEHDLKKLFKMEKIKLDENENDLISRLTIMVVWGGKYPIPKKAIHFKKRTMYGNDFKIFEKLYKKLFKKLK